MNENQKGWALLAAGLLAIVIAVSIETEGGGIVEKSQNGAAVVHTAVEIAKPLVRKFEGLRLDPYWDEGHVAIGYGHDFTGADSLDDIKPWTKTQVEAMLDIDLTERAIQIDNLVSVQLNAPELAALLDFVYNLGIGAFSTSTLLKRLNAGAYQDVPGELMKFIYVGGHRSSWLEERRRAESDLWNHSGRTHDDSGDPK